MKIASTHRTARIEVKLFPEERAAYDEAARKAGYTDASDMVRQTMALKLREILGPGWYER